MIKPLNRWNVDSGFTFGHFRGLAGWPSGFDRDGLTALDYSGGTWLVGSGSAGCFKNLLTVE